MNVQLHEKTGRYYDADGLHPADARYYWTAFCGGCGEEIDVVATYEGGARAVVKAAIAADYVPMTIDRLERRELGVIYF